MKYLIIRGMVCTYSSLGCGSSNLVVVLECCFELAVFISIYFAWLMPLLNQKKIYNKKCVSKIPIKRLD